MAAPTIGLFKQSDKFRFAKKEPHIRRTVKESFNTVFIARLVVPQAAIKG